MTLKDENSEKSRELFLNIGLDEKTVRTIVEDSDKKLTSDLIAVINQANVTDGCDRTAGNLLYKVVTEYKDLVHCPTLLEYIGSSKIKTSAQLLAANAFFKKTGTKDFKLNEFEEACGVDRNFV